MNFRKSLLLFSLFVCALGANLHGGVIVSTDFQAPDYVDGTFITFQNGWLGQSAAMASDTAGDGIVCGPTFTRTMYGANSAHGGTGGVPVNTGFATGDMLSFEVEYQAILGDAYDTASFNDNLARIGFRPDGPNAGNGFDSSPTMGIAIQYNQFDPATGGSLKIWPVMSDENSSNANALIISGFEAGMSPNTMPSDLASDFLTISYKATHDGGGSWSVNQLTVENAATGLNESFDFSANPRTFTYTADDAFYANQYARSPGANGSSGCLDSVHAEFTPVPEPSTFVLVGLAFVGLIAGRRR